MTTENEIRQVLEDSVGPRNVSCWRSHGTVNFLVQSGTALTAEALRVVVGCPRFVALSSRPMDSVIVITFRED